MGDSATEEIPATTEPAAKYIPVNGVRLVNPQVTEEIAKGPRLLKPVGLRSEADVHKNDSTRTENAGDESEGYESCASDGEDEDMNGKNVKLIPPIPSPPPLPSPEGCTVLAAPPGGGFMDQILNAKLKSAKQPPTGTDDNGLNPIEDDVNAEAESPLTKELKERLKNKGSRSTVNIDSFLEKLKHEKCKESELSPEATKIKDSAQDRSTLAELIDERRRQKLEDMRAPKKLDNSEDASTKTNPFLAAGLRRTASQRLPESASASTPPPSQQLLKKRSLPNEGGKSQPHVGSSPSKVTTSDKGNWLNEIQSKTLKITLKNPPVPAKPIKKPIDSGKVDGQPSAMSSLPPICDNDETKCSIFSHTPRTLSDDCDSTTVDFLFPPPPTDTDTYDGCDLDLPLPPPPTMEDGGRHCDPLSAQPPILLPAPQFPSPSLKPIALPAPQAPSPSQKPIPLPAPQAPSPSQKPIPLPAPQPPSLPPKPIALPAPQPPSPSQKPIPLPAPQDPSPSQKPIPLPAPQDPSPSQKPIPLPAPQNPSMTSLTPPEPETLSSSLLCPQEPSTALLTSSEPLIPPEPILTASISKPEHLLTPTEPSPALLTVTQPDPSTCDLKLIVPPELPNLPLPPLELEEPYNLPQATQFIPPTPPPLPDPIASKSKDSETPKLKANQSLNKNPDFQSAFLNQIKSGVKLKRPEEQPCRSNLHEETETPTKFGKNNQSKKSMNMKDIFDNLKETLGDRRSHINPEDSDESDNEWQESEE